MAPLPMNRALRPPEQPRQLPVPTRPLNTLADDSASPMNAQPAGSTCTRTFASRV